MRGNLEKKPNVKHYNRIQMQVFGTRKEDSFSQNKLVLQIFFFFQPANIKFFAFTLKPTHYQRPIYSICNQLVYHHARNSGETDEIRLKRKKNDSEISEMNIQTPKNFVYRTTFFLTREAQTVTIVI